MALGAPIARSAAEFGHFSLGSSGGPSQDLSILLVNVQGSWWVVLRKSRGVNTAILVNQRVPFVSSQEGKLYVGAKENRTRPVAAREGSSFSFSAGAV